MTKKQQKKAVDNLQRLNPKTPNQSNYISEVAANDITICTGPSGTGKSAVAVGIACEYLKYGKVQKIVITRPIVESGNGMGFLPGSLLEKCQPYMVPIIEEMNKYLGKDHVAQLRGGGVIEILPLEFMRGRTLNNSFMILDEAQNATFEQLKMFMTRIGKMSKAVINGDTDQTDLKVGIRGGLDVIIDRLYDLEGIGICELDHTDIVRNDIIAKVLSRLRGA